MTDIFLSYNREDAATAKLFADAFVAEGLTVWWDTALRSGEAYDEVTEAALRGAKAVVVLWSPRSVVSRWVRAEATIADRCKTLVPVTIEPCERPIMFELTQTADLAHWTGDAGDRAWLAFLSDVRGFVGRETSAPVAPVSTSEPAPEPASAKPGERGQAPSLAVLPFTNRSGLSEDDVFAEGLVEDVISALSQGVNVRVIGSMATANLRKGSFGDLAALGRQLGVRYLLEGNVRRMGADLRVTAQLLEAASGTVLWSSRFDRPLAELAALEEALVLELATSLDARVYSVEMERALSKPSDLTAWEAAMRAFNSYRELTNDNLARGLEEAERAIAIAPEYGLPRALLAEILSVRYLLGQPDDPAEVQRIRQIAEHAFALAPEDAYVLNCVGSALNYSGHPKDGLSFMTVAVAKAPGDGMTQIHYACSLFLLGKTKDALAHLDKAEQVMPGHFLLWVVFFFRGIALMCTERWDEAEDAINRAVSLNLLASHWKAYKAYLLRRAGRADEAKREMEQVRNSGLSVEQIETTARRFFANSHVCDEIVSGLRALWAESGGTA
jgi:TolB-like protein